MIDRRQLLAGGCAMLATGATGIETSRPTLPASFTARAVRADLAIVREAYDRLHPGLYRYLRPSAFDDLVAAEMRWADRERTPGEVYIMLSRLTAQVRCGHTFPNPANQRAVMLRELLGRTDRLPFCASWIAGRMIVTDPLSSGLARGTEVRAVDGIPARRLLASMLPLTRADGGNDAKRVAQLELHRADRHATFDVLRPLLQPARPDGTVLLDLAERDGHERRAIVPMMAEGRRGTAASDDPQYGWRFQLDGDGLGILTMPDWSVYQTRWDWRGFLDGVADRLVTERARGLVIDLRENEGGLDCGDQLLGRLVDRTIVSSASRRLVRFRETPAALRPQLETWDESFHTLGVGAAAADGKPGFFDIGPSERSAIVPRGRRFSGPVAVLVGPTCSSATFNFAQLVRRERVATLVGTTTGGNLRGINGGRYFFVRLPETGFELDLPLIAYVPLERQPDRGLDPNIVAATTASDVAAGRDPAMKAARRVCLQG